MARNSKARLFLNSQLFFRPGTLVVFGVFLGFIGLPPQLAARQPVVSEAAGVRRVTLTPGQSRAILLLLQTRPAKPAPLFLFTDPNKDPDDLSVLIETKYLNDQGFVDLRCVLATLGDIETRTIRAKFTRSVLDDLGLINAKVGVGVDYPFEVKNAKGEIDTKASQGRAKDHGVFVETRLLRPDVAVEKDGLQLFKQELQRTEDHTAVFVVNAGMADLAELLRDAPDLVKMKASKVVIMGGVEAKLDQRGFVIADARAYNNSTHQPSADYSYSRLQELGVPLVVVNKEATYSAAAPRSFYDGIAATRHPVGVYLQAQQKQSLHHLWNGIYQGHLPSTLTPKWFFNAFTDVDLNSATGKSAFDQTVAHPDDFEAVWSQVSKFNLYDPLALLAATPGASELLFRTEIPPGVQSKAQVIGKMSVKDSALTKDLLSGIAIESLNPPLPSKTVKPDSK